jgi:hypothetical protein
MRPGFRALSVPPGGQPMRPTVGRAGFVASPRPAFPPFITGPTSAFNFSNFMPFNFGFVPTNFGFVPVNGFVPFNSLNSGTFPFVPVFNPNSLLMNFPFSFNENLSVSGSIPGPILFSRLLNSLAFARQSPFLNALRLAQLQNNLLGTNPFSNSAGINPTLTSAPTGGGGGGYGGSPAYAYATAYGSPASSNPYDTYGSSSTPGRSASNTAADSSSGGGYSPESTTAAVLTALGLPTNGNHLDWPIALVALPGEQSKKLRDQVEAAVLVGAYTKPAANSRLMEEAKTAIQRLQDLTERNRLSMTPGTYKDAEEFLGQIDHALRSMTK